MENKDQEKKTDEVSEESKKETIKKQDIPELTKFQIEKVLKTFEGKIMQRPPAFSALRKIYVRRLKETQSDLLTI